MTLKLSWFAVRGEFADAIAAIHAPISEASLAAVTAAGDIVKREGRAAIAAAGFSRRWQNTLRVDVYPRRAVRGSVNAAAHVYHRIPYAGVFEEGATISGSPLLWVPLSSTPKKIGRDRFTVRQAGRIGGLVTLRQSGGRPPLLGAPMRVTRADMRPGAQPKVTIRKLQAAGQGPTRVVPLFVGVRAVTLRKRFDISGIVRRAADRLAELYAANFRVD